MKNDLISIVVPIYNSELYLSKCIDSIINQTYKNLEIICVNDGSTDSTADILAKYAENDSRIKIITMPNGGISNARNTAHKYVLGQYIMYVDSDDWIELDTCEKALNAAKEFDADVVFWNYVREFGEISKSQYIYGSKNIVFENDVQIKQLHRKFFGPYNEELANPEKLDSVVTVWGKLYRAELIIDKNISFVSTKRVVAEDLLFNVHFFTNVKKAIYLNDCFYHYRKTDSSSFTAKYRTDFVCRLENLYGFLEDYIIENNYNNTFTLALKNRKSLNIIGIGLNLLTADKSINKYKVLREILHSDYFVDAVKSLSLKYFPLHWRIFFLFVKLEFSLGVYIMLKVIRYLKNH